MQLVGIMIMQSKAQSRLLLVTRKQSIGKLRIHSLAWLAFSLFSICELYEAQGFMTLALLSNLHFRPNAPRWIIINVLHKNNKALFEYIIDLFRERFRDIIQS